MYIPYNILFGRFFESRTWVWLIFILCNICKIRNLRKRLTEWLKKVVKQVFLTKTYLFNQNICEFFLISPIKDVARVLVNYNANVSLQCSNNETAVHYASRSRSEPVLRLILEKVPAILFRNISHHIIHICIMYEVKRVSRILVILFLL